MKLHLRTFFSHLIFYPFDADRKKDQRIALISSIAIGILFLGIGHGVCALLKNRIKPKEIKREDLTPIKTPPSPGTGSTTAKKPARPPPPVPNREAKVPTPIATPPSPGTDSTTAKKPTQSPPPVPNKELEDLPVKKEGEPLPVQVKIDKAMKDKLDPLILGGVDSLPIYQQAVSVLDKFPDPKLITAPIMKGVFSKNAVTIQTTRGRPFIIIKMYCELNMKNIENLKRTYFLSSDDKLFSKRKCEGYLILYQTVDSKRKVYWRPWPSLDIEPDFFKTLVTEQDSWGRLEAFFYAGKAEDRNGILWQWQDPESL